MAAITGNTAMQAVFETWINKQFISDLEFSLQHQKFTSRVVMPDHSGGNVARFVDFAPPVANVGYATGSTAFSTEASTTANEIASITTGETNLTISEYGEFIKVGQLYDLASVSGTRERIRKRVADGGAISIDTVVRVQAHASTTVLYALATSAIGGTTSTTGYTSASLMNTALLMQARKILYANTAKGFSDVAGHPRGHFAAVLTPKQELDITTEVTTGRIYWSNAVVNVAGAMGQEKFVNGYIGSVYGVAVYCTQNFVTASVSSTTSDVGYVYADGGVAAAAFDQMDPRIIINEVNSPYKNVNSIAWHALFGAGLHASTRVVKLYSVS